MFSWARLTLTLLIALVCTSVAWAADPVSYIDENGETQTITDYTEMEDLKNTYYSGGWFVVKKNTQINHPLSIRGEARIILADGAVLRLGKKDAPMNPGADVFEVRGNLTIYGQKEQTGKLRIYVDHKKDFGYVIQLHSRDMTVNGGSIVINHKSNYPDNVYGIIGRSFTINRGELSVNTEDSADNSLGVAIRVSRDITINGGNVSVSAKAFNSAGFYASNNTFINGGTVSVASSGNGTINYGIISAGITLGYTNESDRITVDNYYAENLVTTKDGQAFKDDDGNVIAGPTYNDRMTVFAGKTLRPCDAIGFATGSKDATVIPAQEIEIGQIPTKPEDPVRADFNFLGWYADADFTTSFDFTAPLQQSTVAYAKWSASYIDGKGGKRVADNIAKLTGEETVLHSGWYLLDNNISYSNSLKISGDVNIVLADGYTLNARCQTNENGKCNYSPLYGDGNLTIYGQSKQTGKIVTSTSGYNHTFDVANVTVNGGTIAASASSTSAAYGINAQNLTVNRGSITASGAAGYGINAENLTINGGVVTIPENSAGINATSIVINDGSVSVTAIGAYGIKSESVSVNGGNVSATASGNTTFGRYGIYVSGGDITLGYSKDSDYITAYNYYVKNGSVKIKDGQFLKDEDGNVYFGNLAAEQVDAIAGKMLRPYNAIIFETGDENVVVPNQELAIGEIPTKPADPTRNGFEFIGWYADPNYETPFDFTAPFTQSVVAYANWAVYYVDENGEKQSTTDYTELTGKETYTLNSGWYVVGNDISYSSTVVISGDVHLILVDGATMNIGTSESYLNVIGLQGIAANTKLTVYGQSGQTGTLSVYTNAYEKSIEINNMTVNGGSVVSVNGNATSSYGIYVSQDLVVNQGSVMATGRNIGLYVKGEAFINGGSVTVTSQSGNGLYSSGDLVVNGGTVTATEVGDYGMYASKSIILGATKDADHISVKSYSAKNVVISDGLTFKDEDGNMYSGELTADQVAAIAGKTLYPRKVFIFVTGDENVIVPTQELALSEALARPNNPERKGLLFSGWYTDASFETPFYFTAEQNVGAVIYAKWGTNYVDENGEIKVTYKVTELNGDEKYAIPSGWYVVGKDISYSQPLTISGDVNIILVDGCTMRFGTSEQPLHSSGIDGDDDSKLTVYGQRDQTGEINAYTEGTGNSIIVVDNMTINGGSLVLNGMGINGFGLFIGNDLIINRGSVTANGAASNGINVRGDVTVNGGNVTAHGAQNGFLAYGNIVINGGEVRTSSTQSDGLASALKSIAINGGVVIAEDVGDDGIYASKDITLGYTNIKDRIKSKKISAGGSIAIKDGQFLKDEDGNVYSGTLTNEQISSTAGKTLEPAFPVVTYIDENGENQTIDNYTVLTGEETQLTEGWYLAGGNIEYLNTVKMSGNVNIILADGVSMYVGSTEYYLNGNGLDGNGTSNLTIYGQEKQTGVLRVITVGSKNTAVSVENLTVNGGSIYSYAAFGKYGIYAQKDITINKGFVLTLANDRGVFSENGNLIVNGGTLDATAADASYGICINKDIVVNGGSVAANGRTRGIFSEDGNLIVNGGSLNVTASDASQGIFIKKDIVINDGVVIASAKNKGIRSKEGSLIVNGGSFTVSSGIEAFNEVVINSDVTVTGDIISSGKITINSGAVDVKGAISSSGDLTINSGVVTVTTEKMHDFGFYSKDIEVNGGAVTITSLYGGMCAVNNLVINNGSVAIFTTSGRGIETYYATINGGVVTTSSITTAYDIVINGGIVTATGDSGFESIFAGPIVLGYSDDTDRITAKRYADVAESVHIVVKIKDGQMFTDGEGNLYSGTLSDEQINAIAGKTLIPIKLPVAVLVDGEGRKRANIDGAYKGSDIVDIPEDIDVDTVDVARSFTTGVYSTFVFPFDVNTSNIEGLQKVLRFNGLKQKEDNSWVVRMKRLWTDTSSTHVDLSANTPYLILMKDQNLVVHGGVTLRKTVEPVATIDGCDWEFRGTLAYKKWEEGDPELGRVYGFTGQAKDGIKIGQFVKAAAGAYIYPFRAYLIKNAPASAIKSNYAGAKSMTSMSLPSEIDIVVDEDENGEQTTTIGRFNTRTGEFKMLPEYDLKGRKLNGRPKARGAYYGNKVIKK